MSFDPRTIQGEAWLAGRLGIVDLHGGVTTTSLYPGNSPQEQRRERLREEILNRGLAQVVLGRGPDGNADTYSRVFMRLYREAL
jgi:hypothetical protein